MRVLGRTPAPCGWRFPLPFIKQETRRIFKGRTRRPAMALAFEGAIY
jgi:hypothetical protein